MLLSMVEPEVSKRVLLAVAAAYLDQAGVITAIEITQDGSKAVRVDIRHSALDKANQTDEQLGSLRSAVSHSLQPWRHTVRTIEIVP